MPTHASKRVHQLQTTIPPPPDLSSTDPEGRMALAILAIRLGQIKSVRAAAKVYSIKRKTLSLQLNGIQSRRDTIPHNRKLTLSEESVIINYVLDLNSRGFSVRVCVVGEMANLLLDQRQGAHVGKCWTTNFINRRPEIKSIFNRKHDYKRLLCQDPEVIGEWFRRVSNAITKYGIQEGDIHNFNESGFLIGMIATAKVVTGAESRN